MSDAHATDQSLEEIYARAITLAAGRLNEMNENQVNEEFDRDARSVGALVRTAMQVNALKANLEKDADADESADRPDPPSAEDLAAFKAKVVARLERNNRGDCDARDHQLGVQHETTERGKL